MYKEILIATDGSELANRALAHGLKLANEVKARVTIVTVTSTLQRRRRKWLALPTNSSMFQTSIRLRESLRPLRKKAAT
jgi:nucleotide-binding universal stress UspA family protein